MLKLKTTLDRVRYVDKLISRIRNSVGVDAQVLYLEYDSRGEIRKKYIFPDFIFISDKILQYPERIYKLLDMTDYFLEILKDSAGYVLYTDNMINEILSKELEGERREFEIGDIVRVKRGFWRGLKAHIDRMMEDRALLLVKLNTVETVIDVPLSFLQKEDEDGSF